MVQAHTTLATDLPRCFVFDPCFLIIHLERSGLFAWNPTSEDLVADLARLDAAEPDRNFWASYPGGHPFYRHGFSRWYRSAYPLPRLIYPPRWAGWLDYMTIPDVSPLAVAASSPQLVSLNYRGGVDLASYAQHVLGTAASRGPPPSFSDDDPPGHDVTSKASDAEASLSAAARSRSSR